MEFDPRTLTTIWRNLMDFLRKHELFFYSCAALGVMAVIMSEAHDPRQVSVVGFIVCLVIAVVSLIRSMFSSQLFKDMRCAFYVSIGLFFLTGAAVATELWVHVGMLVMLNFAFIFLSQAMRHESSNFSDFLLSYPPISIFFLPWVVKDYFAGRSEKNATT